MADVTEAPACAEEMIASVPVRQCASVERAFSAHAARPGENNRTGIAGRHYPHGHSRQLQERCTAARVDGQALWRIFNLVILNLAVPPPQHLSMYVLP